MPLSRFKNVFCLLLQTQVQEDSKNKRGKILKTNDFVTEEWTFNTATFTVEFITPRAEKHA